MYTYSSPLFFSSSLTPRVSHSPVSRSRVSLSVLTLKSSRGRLFFRPPKRRILKEGRFVVLLLSRFSPFFFFFFFFGTLYIFNSAHYIYTYLFFATILSLFFSPLHIHPYIRRRRLIHLDTYYLTDQSTLDIDTEEQVFFLELACHSEREGFLTRLNFFSFFFFFF